MRSIAETIVELFKPLAALMRMSPKGDPPALSSTAMHRSMCVAILTSIALHCAAFLTVLLRNEDQVPIAAAPTVIDIRFWEADDRDHPGDQHDDGTANNASPNPGNRFEETTVRDPGAGSSPSLDNAPASENTLAEVHEVPGAPADSAPRQIALEVKEVTTDVSAENHHVPVDQSDLLAGSRQSEQRVPPRAMAVQPLPDPLPEIVPMPLQEHQMLAGKFKKWTEDYYRRDPSEPGTSWEFKGKTYTAEFRPEPAPDDMSIERVVIEVSTEENGVKMSTRTRMKRLAFSNFAQFVDRWDPEVQIHDDELDGRFHANSTIHLGYSRRVQPRFHGRVTTSSRGVDTSQSKGRVKREQIFLAGLETGVRKIRLPRHFQPFPGEAAVGRDQVRRFEQDTRITFYADGSYGWEDLEANAAEVRESISDKATYLLGAAKKKLYVRGIIKGKVLVYSPQRIVIAGNLTYARDPLTAPDGGDYLGLVCDKTIEIAHPDITGSGDLLINAAIYAKGSFRTRGYRLREHAVLFIYGSLTAGTLAATEPRFATKIRFDERLETTRPPGFPMSNRYEIEAWAGQWEIEAVAANSMEARQ